MDSYSDASTSVDADDNAFYEQLTRQILMLTDEDDEYTGTCPADVAVEWQRRSPVVCVGSSTTVPRNYYSWSESRRSSVSVVPSRMESLWANSGVGTGVFIPSGGGGSGVAAAHTGSKKSGRRRYNNKARKNNDRGRMYSGAGQRQTIRG